MPNRIIKDSIRTSKSVNSMTDFQFRLWIYLITYVDDYGRGSADPELIKGFVFPRRKSVSESTIQKALSDLANSGSVILYEVGGEPYFCFPNWSAHQRIQTKKSKYPAPPNDVPRCSTVIHGDPPSESNTNNITTTTTTTILTHNTACAREKNAEKNESVQNPVQNSHREFEPPSSFEVYDYFRDELCVDDASTESDVFIAYNAKRGWDCLPNWKAAADLWDARRRKKEGIK